MEFIPSQMVTHLLFIFSPIHIGPFSPMSVITLTSKIQVVNIDDKHCSPKQCQSHREFLFLIQTRCFLYHCIYKNIDLAERERFFFVHSIVNYEYTSGRLNHFERPRGINESSHRLRGSVIYVNIVWYFRRDSERAGNKVMVSKLLYLSTMTFNVCSGISVWAKWSSRVCVACQCVRYRQLKCINV